MTKVTSVYSPPLQLADGSKAIKLESNEVIISTDLICEGPVEGLVDKDGSVLKYLVSETENAADNLSLGKGVYYNDVPILDSRLQKLNFVTAGFNISYGEEISDRVNDYPSTVFRYNQKMYLNEKDYKFSDDTLKANGIAFIKKENGEISNVNVTNNDPAFYTFLTSNGRFSSVNDIITAIDLAKINCQEFSHKIKNKYADQISVQVKIDQLYDTDGGNVKNGGLVFGIELNQDNSDNRYFVLVSTYGVSKAGFTKEILFNINQDNDFSNSSYIKVFALNVKLPPDKAVKLKDFSVSTIVERIKQRGSFSYPFSTIVRSAISSRHFNQDPQRSFDLKLLKIKIPSNYDPEAKEYFGNWDGTFSKFLQWTDNPGWIYWDLATNGRYGVGNGAISEADLNKWETYKIARYCDELVKVKDPRKYQDDSFDVSEDAPNTIIISKNNRTLEDMKKQYPPVIDGGSYASQNGGLSNSLIFLYDISNPDKELVGKSYKKLIWSITEGDSAFSIQLINDFGPRFLFERESSGSLLSSFYTNNVAVPDVIASVEERIKLSGKNSEASAKSHCLLWLNSNKNNTGLAGEFARSIIEADIFDSTLVPAASYGSCSPRVINYKDPLENRFSANIYIDNESECLKLLNDCASIFRGLTYYKNNQITATIDVDKSVSYIFNNTNVKKGVFSYSNGSVDGNYTVAKILFKDKFQNYTDEVEIVEDSFLIREYGIISKEILGFGITSRGQARRIGEWLLATNRFENQTVTFTTDLQAIALKPSDIIQIEDQGKNDTTLQGRVVSVNYSDNYIVVDRAINLNLTGATIKFVFNSSILSFKDLDALGSVSDAELSQTDLGSVIEFRIDRIENNTNRVYLDTTYNIEDLPKVISSTPFIINNVFGNSEDNLYKIISISEVDNNEYNLFCIKHDRNKYDLLDNGSFSDTSTAQNNTISYTKNESLKEIDLQAYPVATYGSYYTTETYLMTGLSSLELDYSFSENRSSLTYSTNKDFFVLTIKFPSVFQYILDKSNAGVAYFAEIQKVFDSGGGILCKVTAKNQSIKFQVPFSAQESKTVFLGRFSDSSSIGFKTITAASGIRLYVYNQNHQIITV